jgi:hypothetical protein
MTGEYVDQAVDNLRTDGVSLRRLDEDGNPEPVGHLEDGTALGHVGRLGGGSGSLSARLACRVVGHRFDGRRMVRWDQEETPAIECSRCHLIRARRPTGADVEGTGEADLPER